MGAPLMYTPVVYMARMYMPSGVHGPKSTDKTRTKRGKNTDQGGLKTTRTDPKYGPSRLKNVPNRPQTRTERLKNTD